MAYFNRGNQNGRDSYVRRFNRAEDEPADGYEASPALKGGETVPPDRNTYEGYEDAYDEYGEYDGYDDGLDELSEDREEEEIPEEERRRINERKFRIAWGAADLVGVLTGVGAILLMVAFLIQMIRFVTTDMTQNFLFLQTKF